MVCHGGLERADLQQPAIWSRPDFDNHASDCHYTTPTPSNRILKINVVFGNHASWVLESAPRYHILKTIEINPPKKSEN
jgi:hypothetical protein